MSQTVISTNNASLYTLSEKDKYYDICYKNTKFKLLKQTENNNYLSFITTDDNADEWITKLNHYSVINDPPLDKLLKKFIKLADKYIKHKVTNETKLKNKNEYNEERDKIKKLINNFDLFINLKNNKNMKKIFDKNQLNDILLNEYMTVWKHLRDNNLGRLELIDNSIYKWKVHIEKFKKSSIQEELHGLNNKFNYKYIEFHIELDDIYYPNAPPSVKVIRPRLRESLMERIANSKQFNLNYWSPSTPLIDIINRIHNIIEIYGHIDFNSKLNNINDYPNGAFLEIENLLLDLSSIIDSVKTDEIDKELIINTKVNLTSKTNTKKYWNAGTGYGHNGSAKWNPDDYSNFQKERNEKIIRIFDNVINSIKNNSTTELQELYCSLKKSILIDFLKQQIKGSSLLDIDKYKSMYDRYFNLIELFCTDIGCDILIEGENDSLYGIMNNLVSEYNDFKDINGDSDVINTVLSIGEKVKSICKDKINSDNLYSSNIKDGSDSKDSSQDKCSKYIDIMDKYKFIVSDTPINNFTSVNNDKGKGSKARCFKRLSVELPTLKKSLPVQYGASIFMYMNKKEINKHRYLITGPVDTPYENGCFIFDGFMSTSYPSVPPYFKFLNTNKHRFNPNLYDSGKVCLSILNTYIGPKPHPSELWLPKESTIYQVIMSILGQILIEEPFFNEPGFESKRGTKYGDKENANYNLKIRLYTMNATIKNLLKDPNSYPEFKDTIIDHFRLKKDDVLKTCQKWVEEALNSNNEKIKNQYIKSYDEIKKLLDKI
jgi:ubiquitin-protein ligase